MLQWLSVDALTGHVIDDLVGLAPQWPLRRTIGQLETAQASLYLPDAPPDWQRDTQPLASVLATFDDADPNKTIQWAGLVTRRVRQAGTGKADLSLETAEHYFTRRTITTDDLYNVVGQNSIIADLITRFVADPGGMPFVVQNVTAGVGALRSKTYKASDFAKVYSRLQELMAEPGGPEGTVDWAWAPDGEHLIPTLLVGDRIGSSPPAGLAPAASFDMPGCLNALISTEDYGDGKGATRVTAYSSGQGNSIPTSGQQVAADTGGRPIIDFTYPPVASTTDTATLIGYAQKTVAKLAPGQVAVALTASAETAPRLGDVWNIGDDVHYACAPITEFPDGLDGVGRSVAVELTIDTISPILAVASIDGSA
jgi:hypothetical protein